MIKEKYMLATLSQLADSITGSIDQEHVLAMPFPDCSFALAGNQPYSAETQDELETIADNSTGWYGFKAIDAGFDSDDLCVIADYYGGGCAELVSAFDGLPRKDFARQLAKAAYLSMRCNDEKVDLKTKLIVRFDKKRFDRLFRGCENTPVPIIRNGIHDVVTFHQLKAGDTCEITNRKVAGPAAYVETPYYFGWMAKDITGNGIFPGDFLY